MNRALDMTEGPLFGKMIRYAVPIMLTGLMQLAFNAADLIVVGQFSAATSVGAVGATGALANLIISLFMGLSVGSGVVVAHAIGAKDDRRISETVHTAMPVAFILGIFLTIAGLVLSPLLLRWMGTPDDIIGLSNVYLRIYFCGIVSTLVYNFGAAILRAAGDSKRPLYYLTASGVLNVLLNLLFVIEFKMDVAGVALATAITQTLSAVLIVIALMRRQDACRFSWKKMHIFKERLLAIMKIGIPSGVQGVLFSLSNVLIQSSVNSFGSSVVSGNSASANIEMIAMHVDTGFTQTALNFVGQNLGAKKYDRVVKIVRISLICAVVSATVIGLLENVFGESLLRLYLGNDTVAVATGMKKFRIMLTLFGLDAGMEVMAASLRGMGKSVQPMIVSLIGICAFRVFWVYTIFTRWPTIDCIYISYPISWGLTFAANSAMYFAEKRKMLAEKEASV